MGGFVVVDIILGERIFGVFVPAAVAGIVVSYSVALATRYLLAATLLAALSSILVSGAVRAASIDEYSPVMGYGAWPGVAELVGLGFLVGWGVRSLKPTAACISAGAAGFALYAMVDLRQDGPYRAEVQLILMSGLAAAIAAGLYLRRVDRGQEQLTLQARHDERLAIARELHDVVAHHVTGIVVQAQAARLVADTRPEAASTALTAIETAGAEALVAMRRMVGALRDDGVAAPVSPAATLADLRDLAERSRVLGLPVRLHIDNATDSLPPELAVSIHRIVRESLTNSQRHAIDATMVDVVIAVRTETVIVAVRDDGRSTRPNRDRQGFGVTGMAERVAALGGRFRAGPVDGGGWQVRAELPLAGVSS